jgi:ABC-2 type transport system permease protein
MADVGVSANATMQPVKAGLFSPLARTQYAAVAEMRSRLFANNLRTNEGALEFGARAASFIIYSFIGLSLGVGACALTYSIVLREGWQYLAVEFWALCFVWQAMSVALASFQEQYDITSLLRFPVGFGSFVLLHLIFGLIDISTIIGTLCSLGILVGFTLARSELFPWAVLTLAGFVAFNILLVRAILAWIDRWLAKRRSREIVSAIFLLLLLSLQLLNPALRNDFNDEELPHPRHHALHHHAESQVEHQAHPLLRTVDAAQTWLPPGLAASAMQHANEHAPVPALASVGMLGVFTLFAGGLLTLRLRSEYRGENLGEARNRKKIETRDSGWLVSNGPIGAVIEKELRTLLRSVPQLYALGVPMLMVFLIGNVFRSGSSGAPHKTFALQLAFPICVAYGLLGFIQLIYNNLGAEGPGIQLLLLSPTPMRTILLGKNLFHATLFGFVALISMFLASLRLGLPSPTVAATTIGWLAFALPANLAAGNILSLTMPYRVNLGRLGRQSGSQANALLSMFIQTAWLGIGAGIISLTALLGALWVGAIILVALALGAVIAWIFVLRRADSIINRRRDKLIARLTKTA